MPKSISLITPALLLALMALLPAGAQQPLAEASVDALVAALAGGPATRSFRRTQLPDSSSNLCEGAAKPAADGPGRRNLEVVPYAGDSAPGVNLSVQFATGSDRLEARDRTLLDNVAAALKSPTLGGDSFAIAGHTDSKGGARINLELSCARALAVQRYLVAKGVAERRLTAYGFGSTHTLKGHDAAASDNRRVEVRKAPQ